MESEPPEEYQQVSLEYIKDTIKNPPSQDETVHRFICDEVGYLRLQPLLEEYHVADVYFNPDLKHLRFITMTSFIHDVPLGWFCDWVSSLKRYPGLSAAQQSASTIERLKGQYSGQRKKPDAAFYPELPGRMPTVAMEIGYPEALPRLQSDARLLLRHMQVHVIMRLALIQ